MYVLGTRVRKMDRDRGGREGACVCERQETIEVIAVKVKNDGKCGVGRRIF